MQVRVLSRAEVERGGAEGADAVISIRASATTDEPELSLALTQASRGESARLLKLAFDDIGMETYGHFVGPTMAQIGEVIEFGRQIREGKCLFDGPGLRPPLIAIHCEHGKSRSAAVALALLADFLGDGNERDAVNTLLSADIENRMHPNPLVVDLTDSYLFRYGRIDSALTELSPRYRNWRQLWREIQANPADYWEKAQKILTQRGRDAHR